MSERPALRAVVLRHEAPSPLGLVGGWLAARVSCVEMLGIGLEDLVPDAREYDLIVSLGSEFPAFDDSVPFIGRETRLIQQAAAADVPVLGLCFGGQLMARVLGGRSFHAQRSEIGWLPVRSSDPELIAEGPWFQWHFDSFTLPPGATLIAETDIGPQPYVLGRSRGLQLHPEVTPHSR